MAYRFLINYVYICRLGWVLLPLHPKKCTQESNLLSCECTCAHAEHIRGIQLEFTLLAILKNCNVDVPVLRKLNDKQMHCQSGIYLAAVDSGDWLLANSNANKCSDQSCLWDLIFASFCHIVSTFAPSRYTRSSFGLQNSFSANSAFTLDLQSLGKSSLQNFFIVPLASSLSASPQSISRVGLSTDGSNLDHSLIKSTKSHVVCFRSFRARCTHTFNRSRMSGWNNIQVDPLANQPIFGCSESQLSSFPSKVIKSGVWF